MIRILGRLFWNIVRTRLAGPEDANRPILVLVEDDTFTGEIKNVKVWDRPLTPSEVVKVFRGEDVP